MGTSGLPRAKATDLDQVNPTNSAPNQAGARGGGNGVEVRIANACLLQSGADDGVNALQVVACGKFGDHPAVNLVHVLRQDDVAQELAIAPQNGCRGLVAAGFHPQNELVIAERLGSAGPSSTTAP